MTTPSPTLRELTGLPAEPAPLSGSALVLIDIQNTYTRGVMALEDVEPAIDDPQVTEEGSTEDPADEPSADGATSDSAQDDAQEDADEEAGDTATTESDE